MNHINIELTSRCNKSPGCWMCGRRKLEREHPELCDWGDMPLEMVKEIADQLKEHENQLTVQFHWNGEPLLYPHLDEAIEAFDFCITGLDTNGILLNEQAESVNLLDTLTISVIQDDPSWQKQYDTVFQYLDNNPKRPIVVFRLLGEIKFRNWWKTLADKFNCLIANRVLHSPDGSFNYQKPVVIPEMGICLEMLNKLAIDRFGNISPCVRFDPLGLNRIGNVSYVQIRQKAQWIDLHINGRRNEVPLCKTCDFWGIPRG